MQYKLPDNINAPSDAERLRNQLTREKGKRFKRTGFFAVDQERRIFEKAFPETREIVQVHLTKYNKIEKVFLLKT